MVEETVVGLGKTEFEKKFGEGSFEKAQQQIARNAQSQTQAQAPAPSRAVSGDGSPPAPSSTPTAQAIQEAQQREVQQIQAKNPTQQVSAFYFDQVGVKTKFEQGIHITPEGTYEVRNVGGGRQAVVRISSAGTVQGSPVVHIPPSQLNRFGDSPTERGAVIDANRQQIISSARELVAQRPEGTATRIVLTADQLIGEFRRPPEAVADRERQARALASQLSSQELIRRTQLGDKIAERALLIQGIRLQTAGEEGIELVDKFLDEKSGRQIGVDAEGKEYVIVKTVDGELLYDRRELETFEHQEALSVEARKRFEEAPEIQKFFIRASSVAGTAFESLFVPFEEAFKDFSRSEGLKGVGERLFAGAKGQVKFFKTAGEVFKERETRGIRLALEARELGLTTREGFVKALQTTIPAGETVLAALPVGAAARGAVGLVSRTALRGVEAVAIIQAIRQPTPVNIGIAATPSILRGASVLKIRSIQIPTAKGFEKVGTFLTAEVGKQEPRTAVLLGVQGRQIIIGVPKRLPEQLTRRFEPTGRGFAIITPAETKVLLQPEVLQQLGIQKQGQQRLFVLRKAVQAAAKPRDVLISREFVKRSAVLSPKEVEAFIKFARAEQRSILSIKGSFPTQSFLLKGLRRPFKDIDVDVESAKVAEKLAARSAAELRKAGGREFRAEGTKVELFGKKGKTKTIEFLSPDDVSPDTSGITARQGFEGVFGVRFEGRLVKLEGVKVRGLTEQIRRKAASVASIQGKLSEVPQPRGTVSPPAFRLKDIPDLIVGLKTKAFLAKGVQKQKLEGIVSRLEKEFPEAAKQLPKEVKVDIPFRDLPSRVSGVQVSQAQPSFTVSKAQEKSLKSELRQSLVARSAVSLPSRPSVPSRPSLASRASVLSKPSVKISPLSKPSVSPVSPKVSPPSKPSLIPKPPSIPSRISPPSKVSVPSRPSTPSRPPTSPVSRPPFRPPSIPSKSGLGSLKSLPSKAPSKPREKKLEPFFRKKLKVDPLSRIRSELVFGKVSEPPTTERRFARAAKDIGFKVESLEQERAPDLTFRIRAGRRGLTFGLEKRRGAF